MSSFISFFFKASATTELYTYCHTLSLHDSLPPFSFQSAAKFSPVRPPGRGRRTCRAGSRPHRDRAFIHLSKEPRQRLAQPNDVGQRFFAADVRVGDRKRVV